MVYQPEPVVAAVEATLAQERAPEDSTRKIILTPPGKRLQHTDLRDLARNSWIILVCGHYEGFDERIRTGIDVREISIGDYVLSGGEPAAFVLLDAIVRLLPGALGNEFSAATDSFSQRLLQYPQYTRPREFQGMRVPEILLSGDHAKIEAWRHEQSVKRTQERRPDLWKSQTRL